MLRSGVPVAGHGRGSALKSLSDGVCFKNHLSLFFLINPQSETRPRGEDSEGPENPDTAPTGTHAGLVVTGIGKTNAQASGAETNLAAELAPPRRVGLSFTSSRGFADSLYNLRLYCSLV